MPGTAPDPVDSLEALVGRTPVVRLRRLSPQGGATVHLKLGSQNPTGSDNDRAALAFIRDAEATGKLGSKLVMASSGNLGISFAWLCASRRIPLTVVMPDHMSLERRALLKAYGVELVLTPAEEGMTGARSRAFELGAQSGAQVVDVFEEPLFERAYAETLAAELVATVQADGGRLDAVVVGMGSGALLAGLLEGLRAPFPECQWIAVEPAVAPGKPHRLQDLGANVETERLSRLKANPRVRLAPVKDADARALQQRLGREEGILAGISTGAVLMAALEHARQLPAGAHVYAVCTDTGERDFSLEELFR